MSASKDIGTWAETKVKRFLNENGFPEAERRALHGQFDVGDILICPGVIAEVKGGHAAEDASDYQLRLWYAEMERERQNAEAHTGILVVKRKGHGPAKIGGWWVVTNEFNLLARYRLDEYVEFMKKLLGRAGDGV